MNTLPMMNRLNEKLRRLDELLLMDLLEITSEDIVDRFQDKIEEKYDYLLRELEEEESYE